MTLIIDGYNFIGRQGGLRGDIEAKRARLLSDLSRYRHARPCTLVVVFDGQGETEDEEYIGGVTAVYSKRGESADAVIVRMAESLGQEGVVITSDQEVQRAASAAGAAVFFSGEFETRLRAVCDRPDDRVQRDTPPAPPPRPNKKGNPFRRSRSDRRRAARLRNL